MRKALFFLFLSAFLLIGSAGFCQVSSLGLPGTSLFGAIGAPEFFVSWAALGKITAKASVAGILHQSLIVDFGGGDFDLIQFARTGSGEGELAFDARGLWLGASIPVHLTNALTLRARGGYFVPSHDAIWASGNFAGSTLRVTTNFSGGVPFDSSSELDTGQGLVRLDASAKTRWFYVEADASYAVAGLAGTSILAGVRYDRLASNISRPSSSNAPPPKFIPASASVTAELNSLTPYVGIGATVGGPLGGVTVHVKGFPAVVFTNAGYKRQNGYFGEFRAEYFTGPLISNLSGSLFVRGDVIHATFTELKDFTSLFTPNGVIPEGLPPRVQNDASSGEAATSIHWNQLEIGGSIILGF
jgi:hypothetical protein